jgi:hypothetical protein
MYLEVHILANHSILTQLPPIIVFPALLAPTLAATSSNVPPMTARMPLPLLVLYTMSAIALERVVVVAAMATAAAAVAVGAAMVAAAATAVVAAAVLVATAMAAMVMASCRAAAVAAGGDGR